MQTALRETSRDQDWNPKYFGVITGLFCGLYMIAMAIGPKIIEIQGFIFSAAIIVFPLCCIITDILSEVYGFNRARQAIWAVLACTIMFAVFTQAAIALPVAGTWVHQESFEKIFSTSLRFAAAGCLAWVAGEFANSFVVSKMKVLQEARHMSVRFIASTVVGQFLDTSVVVIVAFAGTMPWPALFIMIQSGWAAKVAYEIAALPVSVPVTRLVKRLEGVEHFDRQEISLV